MLDPRFRTAKSQLEYFTADIIMILYHKEIGVNEMCLGYCD